MSAPILLWDQQSLTAAGNVAFNSRNLKPVGNMPYVIDSIRFGAIGGIGADTTIGTNQRGILRVSLAYGRRAITDGFVPVWLLGPRRQRLAEGAGYYTWHLPRPLHFDGTEILQASVQIPIGFTLSTTLTVNVALVGKVLSCGELPSEVDVPYVSAWDTNVDGLNYFNPVQTLKNNLSEIVTVTHLTGRMTNSTGTADDDTVSSNNLDARLIRILGPAGEDVTRGLVQFRDVFPPQTRALPYPTTLQPNEGFTVQLGSAPDANGRPQIAFIGYRREQL